ncbi:MAG TPA: hypothetical protein VFU46_08375, partial [Gemmatimonadales bacterium]|nr:hypothetical protein [Gemmatimonadales bacterium]
MVESLLTLILLAAPPPHSDTIKPSPDAAVRALYRRAGCDRRAPLVRLCPLLNAAVLDGAALAQDTLGPDITGERAQGFSYEKLSDALRYDRVQGWSFGLGYRVRVPAIEFAGVQGTVRYGLSDERVTGRLSFRRDAPVGRVVVTGYRDIVDVDPISPGQTIGNALNAIFAAHDDGDYMLATGGGASYATTIAGVQLAITGRVEQQDSVHRAAESDVNDFLGGDGLFPGNAPIDEGTFVGGALSLASVGPLRWSFTADVLGGEGTATARFFAEVRGSVGR